MEEAAIDEGMGIMKRYPANDKPGPPSGFPKARPVGNRRAGRTIKVKAALKRIETLMKQGAVR